MSGAEACTHEECRNLLALASREPEVRGLLALMLLHHARHEARVVGGRVVPLDEQERSRWDRAQVAEGVAVLQGALAEDRRATGGRCSRCRPYLLRMAGDLAEAATTYARAAERCPSTLERDHLVRQAALARAARSSGRVNDG